MIARSRGLLERILMLLVDDDESEPRRRCEDGAACADDHADPARGDLPPLVVAFGGREVAVENGHAAEAGPEAVARLRRQTDLRHEHDRLLSSGERLLDGLQVDLRLAAAGHAEEHDRLVTAGPHGRDNGLECPRLRGRQLIGPLVADRPAGVAAAHAPFDSAGLPQ